MTMCPRRFLTFDLDDELIVRQKDRSNQNVIKTPPRDKPDAPPPTQPTTSPSTEQHLDSRWSRVDQKRAAVRVAAELNATGRAASHPVRGQERTRHLSQDWECDFCGFSNFSQRLRCKKCLEPRPIRTQMSPSRRHEDPSSVDAATNEIHKFAQQQQQHAASRTRKWQCARCENLNNDRALLCDKCGYRRLCLRDSSAPSRRKRKPLPTDWYCKLCRTFNFKSRATCSRCIHPHPKPESRLQFVGDWMCTWCLKINFSERTRCIVCDRVKTDESPVKTGSDDDDECNGQSHHALGQKRSSDQQKQTDVVVNNDTDAKSGPSLVEKDQDEQLGEPSDWSSLMRALEEQQQQSPSGSSTSTVEAKSPLGRAAAARRAHDDDEEEEGRQTFRRPRKTLKERLGGLPTRPDRNVATKNSNKDDDDEADLSHHRRKVHDYQRIGKEKRLERLKRTHEAKARVSKIQKLGVFAELGEEQQSIKAGGAAAGDKEEPGETYYSLDSEAASDSEFKRSTGGSLREEGVRKESIAACRRAAVVGQRDRLLKEWISNDDYDDVGKRKEEEDDLADLRDL